MTKHYFKAILISLLAVAAWSQTAVAQDREFTIDCGDGMVEVNPYAGASGFPEYHGTTFPKPTVYFYKSTSRYTHYVPFGEIGLYQGSWPSAAGEMCDKGPNSPVLCSDTCEVINQVDPDKLDNSKSTYDPTYESKFLNDTTDFSCYATGRCSVGIGNGIIQPATPFHEECDDGNTNDGDGCSSKGKIELAERYVSGVCGNGIVDSGEECDDGNIRNGDGCSSTCDSVGSTPMVCTGYTSEGGAKTSKLCGNGRIDYAFGEQCDEGPKNGEEGGKCRDNCILRTSPVFTEGNVAYWSETKDVSIDSDSSNSPQTPTGLTIPRLFEGQDGLFNRIGNNGKVGKIQNSGQRFVIERDPNVQYSGVLLTDQKIDDLVSGNYFKDGKIHLDLVVSPPPEGYEIWDDDAFGIVFGMKKGDQVDFKGDSDYRYLMLSWRSYSPWTKTYVSPGCTPDKASPYGTPGLRLYQVTGMPSYTQLWTMKEDCGDKTKGSVKEIETWSTDNWTKTEWPWKPQESAWNRVINPFLALNTMYAYNFQKGQGKKDQRLQISAEFSESELKVWVNRVLAIHINRAALEKAEEDANLDPAERTVWPTSGQLGFYYLGMDTIAVDTSGYYSYVTDPSKVDDDKDRKSTTCSGYCGNGIVDGNDECDDGNTNDGDGCDSKCKIENPTDKDDTCRTIKGSQLCYGGKITGPKGTISTQTPTIKGTYSGTTGDIIVDIIDETTGLPVPGCKEDAITTPTKKSWTYDLPLGCTLSDNGKYKTVATFLAPNQSVNGDNFPPIVDESKFTINTNEDSFQVEEPAADTVFVQKTGAPNVTIAGTSTPNVTKIVISVCKKNGSKCIITDEEVVPTSGSWHYDIPKRELVEDTTYTVSVSAQANSVSLPESVEKTLVVRDYSLGKPSIDNLIDKQEVIPNSDGTITVQGKEDIPPECKTGDKFDSSLCAPIFVTVTGNCLVEGTSDHYKDVKVRVNDDGTYNADVPVCGDSGSDATITAKASDDSGLESPEPPTSVTVNLKERATPKIIITCPKPTSAGDKCPLPGDGTSTSDGLVVNGETNVRSQRKVTVKAYEAKKDGTCDFDAIDKGNVALLDSKVVNTTLEGNWTADFKHFQTGTYCIVAELNVDGKPKTTTIAKKYDRKSNIDRNNQDDKPVFVDSPTALASKILRAKDNNESTIEVVVKVPDASNVAIGDKCIIGVAGTQNWPPSPAEGEFYMSETGELFCKAELDIENSGGESLLGQTLTAKSVQKGTTNESEVAEQPVPGATFSVDKTNGNASVYIDNGYPGVSCGDSVSFGDANDSTKNFGSCALTTCDPLNPPKTLTCISPSSPILSDNGTPLIDKDAVTTVVPYIDNKKVPGLDDVVTGIPKNNITCPNGSTLCANATDRVLTVEGESTAANSAVTVAVYKKNGNQSCENGHGAEVYKNTNVTVTTNGAWSTTFSPLSSEEYCIVSTVNGYATDEKAKSTAEVDFQHAKLEKPAFADNSTKVAEDIIGSGGGKFQITVTEEQGSNVQVGDKCKVYVQGDTDWYAESNFVRNITTNKLECPVMIDSKVAGKGSLLGKTLVATAIDKDDPNNVSEVSDPLVIPGLPVLTPEADGKVKIVVDAKYPGAGKGNPVTFRDENGDTVGKCNLQKIAPGNPNADDFECTSDNALSDNGEADGTKLIDKVGSTEVFPFINNGKVPDVKVTIDGKKIGITCAEGSGCTGKTNGLDVTGVVAETPQNGESVKVTVYEKDDNGECSASQHGTKVIATKTGVTVNSDKTWAASFDGLQSGEYCVVAELLDSNNNPIESAAEVATFNRTANIDSNDTVAFVDPDQQPTNIAKAVVDGEATVPVIVKPAATAKNIIAGDKCVITVKDGDSVIDGWGNEGVFEDDKSGGLICSATLDTQNGDKTLLGKTLVAKAKQKGDTDGTKVTPEIEETVPNATMSIDTSTGEATIVVDTNYPGARDGEEVTFNNGTEEVGKCTLRVIEPGKPNAGKLGCRVDSLTEPGGTKLIDKTTDTTVVPHIDGHAVPDGEKVVPAAGVLQTPTIADGGAAIVDKIKAANGGAISVDVKPSENSNIKEGDKCEVYVKSNSNWKAEGTFQTVNGELVCTAEGLKTVNGDKELYGKTLVAKAIAKNNPNNVSTPSQPVTVPDKGESNSGGSGQDGDNNPSGTYTKEGNKVIVKLPPEVVRENDLEVGQKLTILGPDQKQIGEPCTISNGENGNLICVVSNTKSPVPAKADLSGFVTDRQGMQPFRITPGDEEPTYGFVAGGCSTTDSPESGLLALLFAALGFFGIRRRRD